MGRRYTVDANSTASGGPFVSSVQYFNNQTPLGYIFDNIAGVGFIGGLLSLSGHDDIMAAVNSGGYIDNIFTFATGSKTDIVAHVDGNEYSLSGSLNGGLDTLWRIAVLGNILLSKGGLGESDRRSILGNPNQ